MPLKWRQHVSAVRAPANLVRSPGELSNLAGRVHGFRCLRRTSALLRAAHDRAWCRPAKLALPNVGLCPPDNIFHAMSALSLSCRNLGKL